jgi:hypothetical protein
MAAVGQLAICNQRKRENNIGVARKWRNNQQYGESWQPAKAISINNNEKAQ